MSSPNTGPWSDIVATPAALPNPAQRKPGDIALTLTPVATYRRSNTQPGAWIQSSTGPSNPTARSVLTLDPLGVAGPGVYTTWAALWADYLLTSGAVQLWVLNQATVPAGTYVLRSGTVFYGVLRPGIGYDLELAEGAVLQDLEHLVGLSLRSTATATTPLTFSSLGPELLIDDGSNLVNAGAVPMIDWAVDGSGGNFLFLVLVRGPQLQNNGAPVINAHGPGPGQPAIVGIIMGDNSVVGPGSLQGSIDSGFNLITISPTSTIDPSQPLYLGSPPISPAMTNFSTRTSMQLPATNNPQAIDLVGEVNTTNAVATSLLPLVTLPNIGENLLVLVTAVRGSDGEMATWFQQVRLKSVGGVVSGLATDVTPPNIDAGLLVGPVAFNIVFNVPAGQVDFQATGQGVDAIKWTIRVAGNLCTP